MSYKSYLEKSGSTVTLQDPNDTLNINNFSISGSSFSNANYLSAVSFVDINTQGFVDNTQTSILFNIVTSGFTLSAITNWAYYYKGQRNVIIGNKTITISNSGMNFVYIDFVINFAITIVTVAVTTTV